MKHLKSNILTVLVFISLGHSLFSQEEYFNHLGIEDGLSDLAVHCMEQDQLNRIWIGTRDGLNCYDGALIRQYKMLKGDTTTVLGQIIYQLKTSGNYLWILSQSGVSRMNVETGEIRRYENENILSILPYENGLLLGARTGLFLLDNHSWKVSKVDFSPQNAEIKSLFSDKQGNLWIGTTDNGVYIYNRKTFESQHLLEKETIQCIFEDSQHTVWMGTNGSGVFFVNPDTASVSRLELDPGRAASPSNVIRIIKEDDSNNIWIGTFNGIFLYNTKRKKISHIQHSQEHPYSISNNSIYALMKDHQGIMWVGSYYGGVDYLNSEFDGFRYYSEGKGKLSTQLVGNIVEDEKRNLWIATHGGGVNYYERKTGKYTYFSQTGNHKLSKDNINNLALDKNKYLYIATHGGGMNRLNLRTNEVKIFRHAPNDTSSIPSDEVNCIVPYHEHYVVGTSMGTVLFNTKTETFSNILKNDNIFFQEKINVFCVLYDSKGNLWIGTEKKGLYRYNEKTDSIFVYKSSDFNMSSIGSNSIAHIFEDSQHRIWIGANGGGLNIYDKENDSFISCDLGKNNLSADVICGIQEDRRGNIWVTTKTGLVFYNDKEKKFYNYDLSSYFPIKKFIDRSFLLTSDGELFIGSQNGMVSFNEKKMFQPVDSVNVILSSLIINNHVIKPNDGSRILDKELAFKSYLEIPSFAKVFSISFSSDNFLPAHKATYKYRLQGFSEDWYDVDNNQIISFTGLSPKTYKLVIKAFDSVSQNEIGNRMLTIKIIPPFYLRWYAYLFYTLSIGLIILYLYRIRINRVKLEENVKRERLEKEYAEDLNQTRMRFFTNISHEFRTPLTLIIGITEKILEESKLQVSLYNKLSSVYNNASRLNTLISELLDFRKLEVTGVNLQVQEVALQGFMKEIYDSFSAYAVSKKIRFKLNMPHVPVKVWFDVRYMEKVFFNAISNSFKFANRKKGEVVINVTDESEYWAVRIEDNGVGVKPEYVKKVFDRYFQIDNISTGSGIGLAFAKNIVDAHQGKITICNKENESGAVLLIGIKKGNQHFKESEIISNLLLSESKLPIFYEYSLLEENDLRKSHENIPDQTLLIVEDDKDLCRMLDGLLNKNYNVLIAGNGQEGLDLAMKHQPDLIISDVMMDVMSGTEMCERLKRNINTSHIPVILLTAKSLPDQKIEGLQTGADEYLTKPFSPKELELRIHNILQARKNLHQKYYKEIDPKSTEFPVNQVNADFITKINQIIEQHIDNNEFDIEHFSKEICLGRTSLFSKIKSLTGDTPNDYILHYRLKKAANLFQTNPSLNISEVSYRVGFINPNYFSKCFKDYFGETPRSYVKKLQ